MKPQQELFLGRQPILDRNHELCAFELLFRNGDHGSAGTIDDTIASSNVIVQTFSEFGCEEALGKYRGFINFGRSLLLSDVVELLPKDKVVLEILETVDIGPDVVARCQELKAAGFTLALDDVVGMNEGTRLLLPLVDIVKVDIAQIEPTMLEILVRELRGFPVKLLAEKVDSREQVDRCLSLGFELFQGYYFARPTIIRGKRLGSSEVALSRLLGLVISEADTTEIERSIKEQPVVTLKLMRLINSVATGLRREVSSVREALAVIGRRQLLRWLQLLVFSVSSPGDSEPSALLQLAAVRGKLMELLSQRIAGGAPEMTDRAFLTGVMSLMDTVFQVPMAQVLSTLPVADSVRAALLERSGPLGDLLGLAEALEQYEIMRVIEILDRLGGLDLQALNEAHAAALRWANAIATPQN